MRYRKFGNTGYEVSEIGFGTWPLSGGHGVKAFGYADENESIEALQCAYDNGINFFDTSDYYGFGYAESMLGNIFNGVRKNVIIATKVGLINEEGDLDFSTDHMVEAIEHSLKRLRTDCIDIYLLHCPTMEMLQDGRIQSLLETFQIEGMIKEYGISVKSPIQAIDAIEKYSFGIIEINYNILDHRAAQLGVLDLCKEKNVAVIDRTPFGQGVISGEFTYNSDLADKRNSIPRPEFEKTVSAYNEMLRRINDNSRTKAQIALQFCLADERISCVIPGIKTASQVRENVIASGLNLSQSDLDIIYKVYEEYKL